MVSRVGTSARGAWEARNRSPGGACLKLERDLRLRAGLAGLSHGRKLAELDVTVTRSRQEVVTAAVHSDR